MRYNLYWRVDNAKQDVPPGSDAHSKYGDPKFRCAPPLVGRSAFAIPQWDPGQRRLSLCTPGKFHLMGSSFNTLFRVGDCVEVDFDGRLRKVTEATDEFVAFDPPLTRVRHYGWDTLVNWKDRQIFSWDLRLAEDSPGRKMGAEGQDVGASLDMQAYMKGDFNGDGQRDPPVWPADLRKH